MMGIGDFMNDLIIGSHVSYNGTEGLVGSVIEALSYGSNTFMFYTGAPQNTIRSGIDMELTDLAHKTMKEQGINIKNVIVHAPYIINLANDKDEDKFNFGINFLKQELKRTEMLGVNKVVLHPGSHVGLGTEKGIENIIRALNMVLDSEKGPIILLETMAGKGTEIVITFEELQALFDSRDIDITSLEESELDNASYFGRIFARCGGLSDAVAEALKENGNEDFVLSPMVCDGIAECRSALMRADKNLLKNNFIEGMACTGGCVGGAGCLTHSDRNKIDIDKHGSLAHDKTITDAINTANEDI